MSNSLVPISDLERMAVAFAKSNMFGAKTSEQALALLLLAQAEGVHPAVAMRDFDVIQGRPAKKAEAMLRSFLAAGGSVEWHELTDAVVSATFSHPQGGKAKIVWDMERAKKAGLTGKDNWQKYPRPMLRSRVVSEGCRTVYPAATSGLYDTEETRDMDDDRPKRGRPRKDEKNMGDADVVDETVDWQSEQQLKVAPEQIEAIQLALKESGVDMAAFLKKAELSDLKELAATDAPAAVNWIRKQRPARAAA